MNPMVNMIVSLDKEIELERQGMRRTRRYIGDASQVADEHWYQNGVSPVTETGHSVVDASPVAEAEPRRKTQPSLLARLLRLPRTRRQEACNEC